SAGPAHLRGGRAPDRGQLAGVRMGGQQRLSGRNQSRLFHQPAGERGARGAGPRRAPAPLAMGGGGAGGRRRALPQLVLRGAFLRPVRAGQEARHARGGARAHARDRGAAAARGRVPRLPARCRGSGVPAPRPGHGPAADRGGPDHDHAAAAVRRGGAAHSALAGGHAPVHRPHAAARARRADLRRTVHRRAAHRVRPGVGGARAVQHRRAAGAARAARRGSGIGAPMAPVRIVVVLCLAEVLSMTMFATFPALIPVLLPEWDLANAEAGLIGGMFYGGYLLAAPFLTTLTDRMDARRIYLFACLLAALGGFGFAFLARGTATASVCQALIGAGLAGTYMPGLKLLSDLVEESPRRGRLVAFYTSTFGVGASLSYVLVGLIEPGFGWHAAFLVSAFGPLAAALLVWRLPP